jgi:hypothetical protein
MMSILQQQQKNALKLDEKIIIKKMKILKISSFDQVYLRNNIR